MDRPEDYRRVMRWASSDAPLLQSLQLGGLGRERHTLPGMGVLRVGYQGAQPQAPCVAWLRPDDGGTQIGDEVTPIDVPFSICCEQPVTVFVQPVRPILGAICLFLAVTPIEALSDRLYATRTVTGVAGTPIVLPQWVRGVAAIAPATFSWRDRLGAAIGGVQSGAHDRPASAVAVVPVVGGPFTLYY